MATATLAGGTRASTAALQITDLTPISHPSPNFGPRREEAVPEFVVLHYTAMQSFKAALETLCNPENEVSAHYLIDGSGQVFQLVHEDDRAWHAGAGQWRGNTDVNSSSIGIELSNCGSSPFAAKQMDALEDLLSEILSRWAIPPANVIGHSDMALGRKVDPGLRFDWQRLARQNLSVWPEALAPDGKDKFCTDLAAFGYDVGIGFETLLDGFRLRFRPFARGRAFETEDQALAAGLTAHIKTA